MFQSHDFTLRVFPNWETDRDGCFSNLRAYGAFLVTAPWASGSACFIVVESEKGRPLTLENPWPEVNVRLERNGLPAETIQGDSFTTPTKPGDFLLFYPEDRELVDDFCLLEGLISADQTG